MMYKVIPEENIRVVDRVEHIKETDFDSDVLGKIIVSDPSTIIILKNSDEIKDFYYDYNKVYHEAIFTKNGINFLEKEFIKLPVDYVFTTFCIYRTPPFHLIGKKVVEKDIRLIEDAINEDNAYVFDSSIIQRKFMELDNDEFMSKESFIGIKHMEETSLPNMRLLQINSAFNGKYDVTTTEIKFDKKKLDKSINRLRATLTPSWSEVLATKYMDMMDRGGSISCHSTQKVLRKK